MKIKIITVVLVTIVFLLSGFKIETVKAAVGTRNTGWISVYFAGDTSIVPWSQISGLVYQNIYAAGYTDPSLLLQAGTSWSQMKNLADAARANNVPMLVCLWGGGDPGQNDTSPILRTIIQNPNLKAQLIKNLVDLTGTYGLSGIAIDWEGSYPDPDTYAGFLQDLRAGLGPSKLITPIGSWTEVSITSRASQYVDWVSLMSYDYWTLPYY
jgi:spore germination protein YaaH